MINDLKRYMGGEVLVLTVTIWAGSVFPHTDDSDRTFHLKLLSSGKYEKSLSLSIPSFYLFDHFLYQRNTSINSN